MTKFSKFFSLNQSQYELDFVDVDPSRDIPVYVDPYAIEISDDSWSGECSRYIRSFFSELLLSIKENNQARAIFLLSNLHEPQETFLGVSRGTPQGRGLGSGQALQIIAAIRNSKAYKTGILSDLSEMALYIDGIARDKISDLTTNVIREKLCEYTNQQCELHAIPVAQYSGPPLWNPDRLTWRSSPVLLPFVDELPVMLVPKNIVRRKISLDSQEFYNKQLTEFLVAEHLSANDSLVYTLRDGTLRVNKGEVRDAHPHSKAYVAEMAKAHPQLLAMYKELARQHAKMAVFDDGEPSVTSICSQLADVYAEIPTGVKHATKYQHLVLGSLTALFYPDLILPRIEWEIHGGRKRIDIVFTNAANDGFFSQRRDDKKMQANMVIVECKNYSSDIANNELDQLLGRFDKNRGKFGIITCRSVDNEALLLQRCRDAAVRDQGYILCLTDNDIVALLQAKARLDDEIPRDILFGKLSELLR